MRTVSTIDNTYTVCDNGINAHVRSFTFFIFQINYHNIILTYLQLDYFCFFSVIVYTILRILSLQLMMARVVRTGEVKGESNEYRLGVHIIIPVYKICNKEMRRKYKPVVRRLSACFEYTSLLLD